MVVQNPNIFMIKTKYAVKLYVFNFTISQNILYYILISILSNNKKKIQEVLSHNNSIYNNDRSSRFIDSDLIFIYHKLLFNSYLTHPL